MYFGGAICSANCLLQKARAQRSACAVALLAGLLDARGAQPLGGRRKRRALASGVDGGLVTLRNRVAHHWAVPVALDVGLQALALAPPQAAHLLAAHGPPAEALEDLPEP